MRISYSSSNTLAGCERKFFYEKVKVVDHDPDYSENTTALRVGKCFHEILENCDHGEKQLSPGILNEAFSNNEIFTPTEKYSILAMVKKYIPLHLQAGLHIAAIETQIGDGETFIGFVDAIMADCEGGWYIVDLKTASQLSNSLLSRLRNDPQLNIYSHFASDLAEKYSLDLDKFRGIRYRVTTKAKIKMGKNETPQQFMGRVSDRIESYDIFIPASDLNPEKAWSRILKLMETAHSLSTKDESEVLQNFGFCENYFKPCPYWSRCYGDTFSSTAEKYKIYDSTNIPYLGLDDLEDL